MSMKKLSVQEDYFVGIPPVLIAFQSFTSESAPTV